MKIPLASSGLRKQDILAINRVLESGQLTMGEEVRMFERQMSEYLNVKHFVMVNSGSSANLAIIEAMLRPAHNSSNLVPGDGVLVPSVAWPTTVWPLLQLGLVPIFVDVELETLGIDLVKAQDILDSGTFKVKAIFPIHPLGRGLSPIKLENFCATNSLLLINDVCESLGSWIEGSHAGSSGLASSFSFYFSHHITTMEGGGIATNDDLFADDLRSVRSHGWSRDRYDSEEWTASNKSNDDKFLFVSTGFNIRPMEIQAAIGIEQLKSLDQFVERRRAIAERVFSITHESPLRLVGGETLLDPSIRKSHSWMLLPFIINHKNADARRFTINFLKEKEIETRPILTGNFLAQPALEKLAEIKQSASDFPVANQVSSNGFMITAHHDITESQLNYICDSMKELVIRLKEI